MQRRGEERRGVDRRGEGGEEKRRKERRGEERRRGAKGGTVEERPRREEGKERPHLRQLQPRSNSPGAALAPAATPARVDRPAILVQTKTHSRRGQGTEGRGGEPTRECKGDGRVREGKERAEPTIFCRTHKKKNFKR